MNAGFNTMSRAHRIDEFTFDCSFDSLSLANEYEPEMNAFLTAELLPIIDSILDEFDEAGAVWRLDRVEIDLGDIPGADFYAGLIQRVREELSDKLRAMQSNFVSSGSMSIETLPTGLPVQRLSEIQTDLEKLQRFLLTGRLPWHMGATDRHAHEKVLQQVLREHSASAAWIHLLKRLPAAERAVLINRLAAQFPQRMLADVLMRIEPDHAQPLLDFLQLYQRAMSGTGVIPAAQTQTINAVWEKLFAILLQPGQPADNWVSLLDRLVREIVSPHGREALSLLRKIRPFAVQFHEEGKIGSVLYDALLTMEDAYARNLHEDSTQNPVLPVSRNDAQRAVPSKTKGTENERGEEGERLPEITAKSPQPEQTGAVHEDLYARILAALRQAGLIDADFAAMVLKLPATERRQRLHRLLQSSHIKPHIPQLPQAVLLDINYWLSPQAALLIERLLAHSGDWYRLSGSSGKMTQKRWKQRLWTASLDYLLSETGTGTDPVAYLQALVRGVSPEEADIQATLRAWYAALEPNKPDSAIATLLRILLNGAPDGYRTMAESAHPVQELSEESMLVGELHQRLSTGQSTRQHGLHALLDILATQYPAQLRPLYQDLRNRRYDLTAARLNATELHGLVEKLLQLESATDETDRLSFLQAIEKQAEQVHDRQTYYRLLLEDLLHDREIDLEALATQSRQTLLRPGDTHEDWDRQAETESATGSTSQSTKRPFRASNETLYVTIMTALHKAGLTGESHAAAEGNLQPAELRQRLRMTLRTITLHDWTDKLPPSVLMDITYLLAPQAALLNEHLLAHADAGALHRASGIAGQSSREQWRQQLWAASLRYLLALDTADIAPAAYLQALARGVPDESDAQVMLRTWYAALARSEIDGKAQQGVDLQPRLSNRWRDEAIDPEATVAFSQQAAPAAGIAGESRDELANAQPANAASAVRARETQFRTGSAMLYAAVMAELHKAGLIDAYRVAVAGRIQPGELKQQLRAALRTLALHDGVNKLPQSVLMDIAYLLSPQAALLNEHLLAHADTLHRATGIAGQSRREWQQQLWVASLRYLLTLDTTDIAPAAYLQALARGVSDEFNVETTLQAWHEALAWSKTAGAVYTMLTAFGAHTPEKDRTNTARGNSTGTEVIKKSEHAEEKRSAEITAKSAQPEQTGAAHEDLYARIFAALQQAGLIDADFAAMVLKLPAAERRQRLHRLLQSPHIKPHVPRLPQAVLLDISYWLSPQAALLVERLLAHSGDWYRLGSFGRTTQKRWKQRLWTASLDYLLSEAGTETDAVAYLQALVRGVSPEEADVQATLRVWHAALEHSKPDGAIATLLRILINGAPDGHRAVAESAHPVQEFSEENALVRELHQRFATGQSTRQRDLPALLDTLAAQYPAQLRPLYQDLRNRRYNLAAARLSAIELHSLVEKLLQLESAADKTDRLIFLQAIEKQAEQADDRQTYYRLLLENLLHGREIDLEALVAQSQQTLSHSNDAIESPSKQAEAKWATESTPDQSTQQQPHANNGALYATIMAALRRAGLTGESHIVAKGNLQPAELKKRLRMTLRTITLHDWTDKLPPSVLMEITYLLAPQAALLNEHLLAHADALYRASGIAGQSSRKHWQQQLWAASLRYLLTLDTIDIAPAAYLQALARGVSDEFSVEVTLRAWYAALARKKTSAAIRRWLQALLETPAESLHPAQENSVSEVESEQSLPPGQPAVIDFDALLSRTESNDVTEEIYIDNAGQVLAAPYLPRLFSMLKLVEEGAFVDRHAAERAVHLLQFMVNEQTQSPEYQLTLNKILCGVSTGIPICGEIDISVQEQETIEGLIRGMIQNWKTIGNTSISGLRETFLRRKGRLQLKEDGMWYLTIEPGVFDMLLDSLPWSFSVIKHTWMERAVHVTWR